MLSVTQVAIDERPLEWDTGGGGKLKEDKVGAGDKQTRLATDAE